MEQDGVTGQGNVENTLQYDPDVINFDYSNRMMSEPILTGAMNATQPNVVPDSYNYNNYLPNSGFYTDSSLSQPHIPLKPSEQPFCVDMNHTVHPDNSYINTPDPQLCIDIANNSTNLNIPQETNQYAVPNDVDIKNNYFHEEKHILNNDYANNQLSMNPVSLDGNTSVNNSFSQINSHNELYCGDSLQEPISIDESAADEKPFANEVENLDEASNAAISEPPTEVQADVELNTISEPPTTIKTELKQEEIDLDNVQEQIATSAPVETLLNDKTSTQSCTVENDNDAASHPITNGVDKINLEDEHNDIQMCIRSGCTNPAVNNLEWEQEFCSNECVIIHCKNVFTTWVKTNEITT